MSRVDGWMDGYLVVWGHSMIAFLLFLLDIVHSMRVSLCWKMQHMVRT
jgi:hypothetical protein